MNNKIVILASIGIIFFASSLVAQEKNQLSLNERKITFTKKDYVKTGAALGGLLFCMTAALKTPAVVEALQKNKGGFAYWYDVPSFIMALPLIVASELILWVTKSQNKTVNFASMIFGISGTLSGIVTGLLGKYVYNKVGQVKRARALDKKLSI